MEGKKLLLLLSVVLWVVLMGSCRKEDIKKPVVTVANDSISSIVINIDGMKNTNGKIDVALYKSESSYNKPSEVYREIIADVSGLTMRVTIDSVPPGVYTFALFQDENSNKTLDKNSVGIPKEGFAFSNNASATFGPPDYNNAKFTVEPKTVVAHKVTLYFY